MEVVIKISEEKLNTIKRKMYCGIYDSDLYDAIRNGTPLPKGHGDLVDRNDLKYEKYNSYAYAIANAPTIIEADKEGAGQ